MLKSANNTHFQLVPSFCKRRLMVLNVGYVIITGQDASIDEACALVMFKLSPLCKPGDPISKATS